MAYTGNTPALTEFWFEDFALTYLISGSPVIADVGKAVTLAGVVVIALHVFTLGARKPADDDDDDDDDAPAPLPPGPRD